MRTDKKLRSLLQPVSTVTFYHGVPPLKILRERVAAVVTKNPWLAGDYRKHPETGKFPCLWIPDKPDTSKCFEVVNKLNIHAGMSYSQIERSVTPFLVNKGKAWRGKGPNPPFKVIVLPDKEDSFAVVVSLCHTLGDGYTFYNIYKMLSELTPITTMDAVRVDTWEDRLKYIGKEKIYWLKSLTTLGPILFKLLINRNKPVYRYVNMD